MICCWARYAHNVVFTQGAARILSIGCTLLPPFACARPVLRCRHAAVLARLYLCCVLLLPWLPGGLFVSAPPCACTCQSCLQVAARRAACQWEVCHTGQLHCTAKSWKGRDAKVDVGGCPSPQSVHTATAAFRGCTARATQCTVPGARSPTCTLTGAQQNIFSSLPLYALEGNHLQSRATLTPARGRASLHVSRSHLLPGQTP